MVYVDYKYYVEEYLGTLPEDSFNPLVLKASREIDRNVNTRLNQEIINRLPKEAQVQLKYTVCALIDLFFKKQDNEKTKLSSISIDGVTKSFKHTSNNELILEQSEILKSLPDELTCYL